MFRRMAIAIAAAMWTDSPKSWAILNSFRANRHKHRQNQNRQSQTPQPRPRSSQSWIVYPPVNQLVKAVHVAHFRCISLGCGGKIKDNIFCTNLRAEIRLTGDESSRTVNGGFLGTLEGL
ncbi:MAG TPA: hypothetical protein VKE71_11260 [Candidatus Angelobacter sp.]|nr:hypothetical protein [Candidatus Angelobacter sp.]